MWECIKLAVQTVALFYCTIWIIAFIWACFQHRKEGAELITNASKRFSTKDKLFYGFFVLLFTLNFILN